MVRVSGHAGFCFAVSCMAGMRVVPVLYAGSFANRSNTPRRAAVINYFADGTISNTDDEIVKGVRVAKGSPMTGKLFPLVYSPSW